MFALSFCREYVPEAQCFIGGTCADHASLGGEGHVEHTGGMAPQLLDPRHAGILPETQLVLDVSMAAEDLLLVGRPLQRAHLGAGVHRVDEGARAGIPELDTTVRGTPAAGEQVALVWRPGQSLHRGLVVGECVLGRGVHGVEVSALGDAQCVVVRTRGEIGAVRGPRQTTDFLGMVQHLANNVVLYTHVMVDDCIVPGAGGQDVAVPCERPYSGGMAIQGADLSLRLHVPQLHSVFRSTHRKMIAALLNPSQR
mmetsp:Transcript_13203/g.22089  ORF Transcript_13203/g.22089 Transcript_13203/m.22089 type:complete len:254 (-) Transcript_13203:627-1388(-)